ncbi:MAG: type II secretion system protein GspG [Planctomycetota bacterium]|jgi:general secretion pathway protein G
MKCDKNNRRRSARRHSRRAFTLLEMIVVVTIIALLAALVAPRALKWLLKSQQKVAKAEASKLAETVRLYLLDNMLTKPFAGMELGVLLEGDDPYLEKADDILDPWQNEYVLIVPGQVNIEFDIVSTGEDGELGTEDDISH